MGSGRERLRISMSECVRLSRRGLISRTEVTLGVIETRMMC